QDIHWAAGLFGYFPTYTIGNLISVQLKNAIEKELLPLNDLILNNRFIELKEWFTEKIHQNAKRKKPLDLLNDICGEKLNIAPFIDYIMDKYNKLFQI
ncbi:MAG: carboxypeptidase M32, partial [Calditrichia bacterium]|nr:carboxypeptidase M32 [Calditrichia bacterium]